MNFEDLILLYEEYKNKYGEKAYNKISALLKEAKEIHKNIGKRTPHKMETMNNRGGHLKERILKNLFII